jgi:hypothetical protein
MTELNLERLPRALVDKDTAALPALYATREAIRRKRSSR